MKHFVVATAAAGIVAVKVEAEGFVVVVAVVVVVVVTAAAAAAAAIVVVVVVVVVSLLSSLSWSPSPSSSLWRRVTMMGMMDDGDIGDSGNAGNATRTAVVAICIPQQEEHQRNMSMHKAKNKQKRKLVHNPKQGASACPHTAADYNNSEAHARACWLPGQLPNPHTPKPAHTGS